MTRKLPAAEVAPSAPSLPPHPASASPSGASKRGFTLSLGVSLVWLLLLSGAKTLLVPEFHKDAQYYTQAALLWPEGKVSFAGSLIGDRHQTVGYYRLFLDRLGESLDSLAVALSLLFFLHGLSVIGLAFSLIARPALAAAVSLVLLLISYGGALWGVPASEPAFLTANALLLLVWARAVLALPRIRIFRLWTIGLCLAIGVLSAFRPGNVLFLGASLLGAALVELLHPSRWRWLRPAALVVLGLLSFRVGTAISEGLWKSWVPVDRPPSFFYSMLLYQPIVEDGAAENGPMTALTLGLMGMDELDYWTTLGFTYGHYGAERSDRILRDIGLEAMAAHPIETWQRTVAQFATYLAMPSLELDVAPESAEERWERARRRLADLDALRVATSAKFGGDFTTSTRHLADRSFPPLAWLRRVLPPVSFELTLPGWLLVAMFLALAYLAVRRRYRLLLIWLPYVCLTVGSVAAAAFSQGMLPRYSEAFLPGAVWIVAFTLLARPRSQAAASGDRNRLAPHVTV